MKELITLVVVALLAAGTAGPKSTKNASPNGAAKVIRSEVSLKGYLPETSQSASENVEMMEIPSKDSIQKLLDRPSEELTPQEFCWKMTYYKNQINYFEIRPWERGIEGYHQYVEYWAYHTLIEGKGLKPILDKYPEMKLSVILSKNWSETAGGLAGAGRRGAEFGIMGSGIKGKDKRHWQDPNVEYQAYESRYSMYLDFVQLLLIQSLNIHHVLIVLLRADNLLLACGIGGVNCFSAPLFHNLSFSLQPFAQRFKRGYIDRRRGTATSTPTAADANAANIG